MKNRITELLGIRYPIFQGSMAYISTGKFVAAVTETGALGVIAGAGKNPEEIKNEIDDYRTLSDKPFAVNIVMHPEDSISGIVDVLIKEKVKIAITSAGNPRNWIPVMKKAGIIVICVVASPEQAVKAAAVGADAVIAEGSESGGHIGDAHTFPLVPAVVSAVSIPVIAAGGIADGRGMAAAMMLGAEAVQCGTAFLVTDECPVSHIYKQRILEAKVTDTLVTGRSTNDVVRGIRNPLCESMYEMELKAADPDKIIEMGTGSLRRAVFDGNWDTGSFQAGQSVGLIHRLTTCKELVEKLMQETQETILHQARLFTPDGGK